MAKRKPSLHDVEKRLGYQLDEIIDIGECCYCDLTPVPSSRHERTEIEHASLLKEGRAFPHYPIDVLLHASSPLQDVNAFLQKAATHGSEITIGESNLAGIYKYIAVIIHETGFQLRLLLTKIELSIILKAARLLPSESISSKDQDHPTLPHCGQAQRSSTFLQLPQEIRDSIYQYSLSREHWENDISTYDLCTALGDPTGFYYTLHDTSPLLRSCKSIRQEALRLAYHHTTFHLSDIQSTVTFLLVIGSVGRQNIESLDFLWETTIRLGSSGLESDYMRLPVRHVSHCIQLLKDCKRLRFLQVKFDRDKIEEMSEAAFASDPGINALGSLGGLNKVDITDPFDSPLDDLASVQWLKSQIYSNSTATH